MRNIKGEPREIEDDKHDSDMEKRILQFLEANNSAAYSIAKKKRPSRSLDMLGTSFRWIKLIKAIFRLQIEGLHSRKR